MSTSPTTAEPLPTHTPRLFLQAVSRAAEILRAGGVVALPTETVYGLAANALDEAAVQKIFEIKGRPSHNPVIVHVAGVEMAKTCTSDWSPAARLLAQAFWPGPLTLVLPRAKNIPDAVTAGGPTVGLRWPGHPFIQAVICECRFPLAAPSANSSNRVSPTNAAHVVHDLGAKVPLIVDGGQCQVGIESTVLDLTSDPPRVLRPGMIHAESLRAVLSELGLGVAEAASGGVQEALKSPGLLPKHYAPQAKLVVMAWKDDHEFQARLKAQTSKDEIVHVIAHTIIPSLGDAGRVSVIPHDAEAFARAIYAELHRCDDAGAECIIVEALPDTAEWRAIADRLKRAAA